MSVSNKNRRGVIVGLFIFLGIAIIVVAILTLGGQQKTFAKSIKVKARFTDVEGLQKGNNIWFSGVKIGTVKKISFYGSSEVEVELDIQESSREYIRRDAKAKIGSDGLIGSRLVVVYGGTDKAPPIEDGDVLKVDKAVTTDEMMNTLQTNNRNLLDITTDIKNITQRLNKGEGSLGKLLTDESLANQMQLVMGNLRRASDNTQRLTTTVAQYTSNLNKQGTLANELVTDTMVFARIRESAIQVNKLTETANTVVNDLKAASQNLSNGLENKNSAIGVLMYDDKLGTQLRSTMQNLNSGTKKLDENLEALQHNFLLRGFFKKRAKREEDSIKQGLKVME